MVKTKDKPMVKTKDRPRGERLAPQPGHRGDKLDVKKVDLSKYLVVRLNGRNWAHTGNRFATWARANALIDALVEDGEVLDVETLEPAEVSDEEWAHAARTAVPLLERRARLRGHHTYTDEQLRVANPALYRAFERVREILTKGEAA